jgi:hypothetical protein
MSDITVVVPVNKGGVAGDTAALAAAALNAIDRAKINAPSGVLGVGADGKIGIGSLPLSSINNVTVKGVRELGVSATTTFLITNFDTKTVYNVSATVGTISLAGNVITYTAPATAQTAQIIINGRTITLPIVASRPKAPTVTALDFGTTVTVGLNLSASAFEMISGTGTHVSTDWEVSTSSTFATLFYTSYANTTGLVSLLTKGYNVATQYFVRARYRDNNGQVGSWSQPYAITTKSSYKLNIEIATIVGSDAALNDYYGCDIAISTDGSRLVVGSYAADVSGTSNAGAAYIYRRENLSWVFESKIVAPTLAVNGYFGFTVAVSADGTRVVIGSYGAGSAAGAVYVYLRSGTSWLLEATLVVTNGLSSGDAFGSSVSISADGTRIASGAYAKLNGSLAAAGAAFTFTRVNTTWTQEAKFTPTVPGANDYFGRTVNLTPDGTRLFVGAYNQTVSGVTSGAAYCFSRSGTVWTQEAMFVPITPEVTEQFGLTMATDTTGIRVAISSGRKTVGGKANAGSIDVYSRANTTWTKEATIVSSDVAASDFFGYGLDMTGDGAVIAAASFGADTDGLTNNGAYYIFKRSAAVWTQDLKATSSYKVAAGNLGGGVAITNDGTFLAVSQNGNPNGIQNAGSVSIFKS